MKQGVSLALASKNIKNQQRNWPVNQRSLLGKQKKNSLWEQSKSAIADHAHQFNHVIDWDSAKVLQMESDSCAWYIRESQWIRKRGANVMNHDEGAYFLSHVYDPLLTSLDSQQTGSQIKMMGHSEEVCSQ